MPRLTNWLRVLGLVLIALPLLSGCRGKAGQQATTKVAERAKSVARNKKVREFVEDVSKEVAQTAAEELVEQVWKPRDQDAKPLTFVRRERFPYPASSVRPVAGTRAFFNAATGLSEQPNNFGGLNFYHADGSPAGFSALARSTGQIHSFDVLGYRLQ